MITIIVKSLSFQKRIYHAKSPQ